MESTTAEERAERLLERMRGTPMRRGALSRGACTIKRRMSQAFADQGVPPLLAQRLAFQFAFKFRRRELGDEPEWRAIGEMVRREVVRLRREVGMSDQRIAAALPKLSAERLVDFLDELTQTDRRIARTILHAAVNTSEPIPTGRRYLSEYRLIVRKLKGLDPTMARTVAAASFSANVPLSKAMEYLQRFSSLMAQHQDNPRMARRLARAAFRAS